MLFRYLGNGKLIDLLAQENVDFNAKDNESNAPIHLASLNGNQQIMHFMIKNHYSMIEIDVPIIPILSTVIHYKIHQYDFD